MYVNVPFFKKYIYALKEYKVANRKRSGNWNF